MKIIGLVNCFESGVVVKILDAYFKKSKNKVKFYYLRKPFSKYISINHKDIETIYDLNRLNKLDNDLKFVVIIIDQAYLVERINSIVSYKFDVVLLHKENINRINLDESIKFDNLFLIDSNDEFHSKYILKGKNVNTVNNKNPYLKFDHNHIIYQTKLISTRQVNAIEYTIRMLDKLNITHKRILKKTIKRFQYDNYMELDIKKGRKIIFDNLNLDCEYKTKELLYHLNNSKYKILLFGKHVYNTENLYGDTKKSVEILFKKSTQVYFPLAFKEQAKTTIKNFLGGKGHHVKLIEQNDENILGVLKGIRKNEILLILTTDEKNYKEIKEVLK